MPYTDLLATSSRKQWERITVKRRSGVAVPLFSLYSQTSIGNGEFRDLRLLIDWCRATGLSIIQLLPMNEVGFGFTPYDAQSSFALESMYLAIEELTEVSLAPFREAIAALRRRFPPGGERVDYKVKAAKLELLWKIFKKTAGKKSSRLSQYARENKYWLEDYALFKAIKERREGKAWGNWESGLREKHQAGIRLFKRSQASRIKFHEWLQWQAYEQFAAIKRYAATKNVLLMGDLPFLVSRDSADVWAHRDYFRLSFSAGAPPDLVFSKGQRWGMPPYDWEAMSQHGFDLLIQKLKYAQNFYDLFRLDHAVGVFRLWSVPLPEPLESAGSKGAFDPPDETLWEDHGRRLLSVMVENTSLLPCAEDLGTVPACSYKVLNEMGLPGTEVQRWLKEEGEDRGFKRPEAYRRTAMAVLSTHDTSSLAGWWELEAGTIDEYRFRISCQTKGVPFKRIKDSLFDLKDAHHGRLKWKKEVDSIPVLLNHLGLTESDAGDLIETYKSSYHEKAQYWDYLEMPAPVSEKASSAFVQRALKKINSTASIFNIQMLHDWLSLDESLGLDPWSFRINFPGTTDDRNWSVVMPVSLEQIKGLGVNETIRMINKETERIPWGS